MKTHFEYYIECNLLLKYYIFLPTLNQLSTNLMDNLHLEVYIIGKRSYCENDGAERRKKNCVMEENE